MLILYTQNVRLSLKPHQQLWVKLPDINFMVCCHKVHAVQYLCLLVIPFFFQLVESLQQPAKVGNTKVKADSFVVLLWCTDKQLQELRINFPLFFWRELFLSGDDNTERRKME